MTEQRTPEYNPAEAKGSPHAWVVGETGTGKTVLSGYPFPVDDPERDAALRASLGVETPEEVQARLLDEIDRLKREKLAWKHEALRLGSDGLGGGRGS